MIRLPTYPYGPASEAWHSAKRWLVMHGNNGYSDFDYPDYAGMPKSISAKLTPDEVDVIQDHWIPASEN
jgi:hypothetical protein